MDKNSFKNNLKVENPPVLVEYSAQSLLMELGLFPVPEKVQVYLSDDKQYLNFRLKNGKSIRNQHILFQLPLVEKDLSALKDRKDYQELLNRYNQYTTEYIDEIKDYAMQERKFLKEKFPGLVFNIKLRIKSYDSYIDKINKNIKLGKSPYINDIMGERIIISEYNGSQDEKLLTKMCYNVAKALYDYRINTNFRMQEDSIDNTARTEKEYVSKDYIAHPKENGYKSLHLLMHNKKNKDLDYETQIRTFEMEELSKNNDKMSHSDYKPRIINDLSVNRVPLYSIVTPFDDFENKPIVLDASFKNRFFHFYNSTISKKQFKKDEEIPLITHEKYIKEMYEISDLLGMSFKEIREKLRNIDVSKYANKKEISENKQSQKNNDNQITL